MLILFFIGTCSGHTSTVWALSFNSTGDKLVTCRYPFFSLFFEKNNLVFFYCVRMLGVFADRFLTIFSSDDLSLKVWNTKDDPTQTSSDGFKPW